MDLKPLRKPLVLLAVGAFSVGMAFVPDHGGDQLAVLSGLTFLLYLVFGD